MSDIYKAMREMRKERHQNWFESNMDAINAANIPYEWRATSLLFREPGKPKVDFYPHTGRWRVVGAHSKTFRGGGKSFVAWYEKQGRS